MTNLRRFLGLILVLAAVPRCETENGNALESSGTPMAPETPMATVQGVVADGGYGFPIVSATISLIGQGITRMTTSRQDGTFMFADVPQGAFTVAAAGVGVTCGSASVDVQAGKAVQANISCTGNATIRGVLNAGFAFESATISLTRQGITRTTALGQDGTFRFRDLPPGLFTLNAVTNHPTLPPVHFTCKSTSIDVHAGQTVQANISCPLGTIRVAVRINGELRPIVWVELFRNNFAWAYGTNLPSGTWEVLTPAADYVVHIKTPPGLTCDAKSRPVTVGEQVTTVNFSSTGEVKGSIQGIASTEFGTFAGARVTLTGPVNQETIGDANGFFAFEDLPAGVYLVSLCSDEESVTVRDGAIAFVQLDCS